jgi:hypothetical protein
MSSPLVEKRVRVQPRNLKYKNYKPILCAITPGIMSFNKTCKTGTDSAEILITKLPLFLLMVHFKSNLSFSSNHPTLRQKGLVIKEKVVNFLLEINYSS